MEKGVSLFCGSWWLIPVLFALRWSRQKGPLFQGLPVYYTVLSQKKFIISWTSVWITVGFSILFSFTKEMGILD